MNNIQNQIWNYNAKDLLIPTRYSRAIIFGDDILVVSGQTDNSIDITQIQVIKTLTNEIVFAGNNFVSLASVVAVNNIIYSFGGIGLNTWMYSDSGFPNTMSPTTSNPTTIEPTTSNPTTAIPTTSNPTTVNPATVIPTALPTTVNPTTVIPTTAMLTTANSITSNPATAIPTTFIPTANPTTSDGTTDLSTDIPSISTQNPSKFPTFGNIYPISIIIVFQYEIQVNINATQIIMQTIYQIVDETIDNNDCVSLDSNYDDTSTRTDVNTTVIEMQLSVCDQESQSRLQIAFSINLKTDIITNIND
eukprot:447718_1